MNGLVSKAKKRDKAAFIKLIRQCESGMYKVSRSLLTNDEDAADAMQETILICWEKIETLKKNEYFKTWMTRILINECYAILREKKTLFLEEEIPESGVMERSFGTKDETIFDIKVKCEIKIGKGVKEYEGV